MVGEKGTKRGCTSARFRRVLVASALGVLLGVGDAKPALADASAAPADASWRARLDLAREHMLGGQYETARAELDALAASATTDADRTVALELSRLAASYAARAAAKAGPEGAPPAPADPGVASASRSAVRSGDELTLLYATSFLYGAGTGTWFLLQTQPDSALTATLPFAALTAAPILAVATIDGYRKLPRGVPHAISAGIYLGLGQGVWLLGYQHARSRRIEEAGDGADVRWSPESSSTVLWMGATLGGVLGYALGSSVVSTPGRVSFTASTTMWAGALTGLGFAAVLPDDAYRRESAFVAGGVAYNAGFAFGLLGASAVSPSVTRVRLVDLLGVAGGLATTGLYLAATDDVHVRTAEGLAVAGAAVGLATGWLVTSGMAKELPATTPSPRGAGVVVNPSIVPVRGGATLGVSGAL